MIRGRVPVDELKADCGGTRERMTATLRAWGLPALPDVDGWPVVLRADLERVHGLQTAADKPAGRRKRPRLDSATM